MRILVRSFVMAAALAEGLVPTAVSMPVWAQAVAGKAPSASGTVKAVTPTDLVVTTKDGAEVAVTVPAGAKVLIVPPGSTSLGSATPGTMADVQAGDRAIVMGTAGDALPSLNATRVILMKSGAIAERNSATEQAWAQGIGGIVKGVSGSTFMVASGGKTIAISITPQTSVRRYAPGSVRFEDAIKSDATSIHPGDQLRARGTRSPDGLAMVADEIVTGSFTNLSGVLTAVDPQAGTVTFKDLKTKKVVVLALTDKSDVRRLPAAMAMRLAAMGGRSGGATGGATDAARPSGGPPPGGAPHAGRAEGTGADLSRMLSRLPTETLAGLKPQDAVMAVATAEGPGPMTAITLLVGVEQILAASPNGQTELTPWSMGSGEAGGGEGEPR